MNLNAIKLKIPVTILGPKPVAGSTGSIALRLIPCSAASLIAHTQNMVPSTTVTLPFVAIALIAFAGIVAGDCENRQTDLPTIVYKYEDTTPFDHLENETTDDHTTGTSPTTQPTVQTTQFSTAKPIEFTCKQGTSSTPIPIIKLKLGTPTTTMATTKLVPGTFVINSTEGKASTKYDWHIATTIETVSPTEGKKPTEATKPLMKFWIPVKINPETTPTPTTSTEETTFFQTPENSTFSTEGRDIMDPIEQELEDTFNSMPKLPELVLSNETYFKFYQDPEEASLDERITQIARQLAETGLRREYEERKLGHSIPISVRPIEHIAPPSYHPKSKSIKFVKSEAPTHYKSSLLKVLTKSKSSPGNENLDKTAYEIVTNLPEILRKNKSDKQIREINGLIKVGGKKLFSDTTDNMVPTKLPIFFELLHTSEKGNSGTETKSESVQVATTTTGKDLTTRGKQLTEDTTYYSYTKTTANL